MASKQGARVVCHATKAAMGRHVDVSIAVLFGALTQMGCSAAPTAGDTDASEDKLTGQIVGCEPIALPGISTRVFPSATSSSVFYAVPEQWHVVSARSHDMFLHENALSTTSKTAAESSPFFKEVFVQFRAHWTTFESADTLLAALRTQTGDASVELRELASVSPPSVRSTLAVEPSDLVASKNAFVGRDVVTTVLSRNSVGFNGNEINKFAELFENKHGIVGLGRSFSYQCVQAGAAPSVRTLQLRDGISPVTGGLNEIRYDSSGVDVANDAELPLLTIQLLDAVNELGIALDGVAPSAKAKTVQDAYLRAGWAEWRDWAMAELQSETSWGEPWNVGHVLLSEVRIRADALRRNLLVIVQAGADSVGSPEAPLAFLKGSSDAVSFRLVEIVFPYLDRLAAFQQQHHLVAFKR
jgi:hypothetical protein